MKLTKPPHYCHALPVLPVPLLRLLSLTPLPSAPFYPPLHFPLPLSWLHLLLFDLPFPLFTFPAVCGFAEIEDSLKCLPVGHCSGEGRAGEQCVCVHVHVCVCLYVWLLPQWVPGSPYVMNMESLPEPSQYRTGSHTALPSEQMKGLALV